MALRIKPVAILPTLCTLGNTFCGFLTIAKTADALLRPEHFTGNIQFAAAMILLAMVFDALDGKIARITNQASDFGAQMDSLTDLVTFGVAPAFLLKVLCERTLTEAGIHYQQKFTLLLAFVYMACAALRLARFTIETDLDESAHDKFYGLPSPAAAGVVASTVFLLLGSQSPLADIDRQTQVTLIRLAPWMLPLLGLLMVSRVEYVHLVSRWFRGRKPFVHLVAVMLLIVVIFTHHEVGFFLCFALYAIAGPFMALVERTTGRRIFAPARYDEIDGAATTALIAMGSNLGDRESHLRFAIDEITRLPETTLLETSPVIETEPEGGPPQRRFMNAAITISTGLEPRELLRALQDIERRRGRERTVKDGPRTLDLDLVLFGSTICESAELTLPHPRFRERRFVLEPAVAVAPDMVDPVTGRTLRALLQDLEAREPR